MSGLGLVTSGDLAFVAAAYGLILGGVGLYALSLARRLRRARHASSYETAHAHLASGPSAEPPPDSST